MSDQTLQSVQTLQPHHRYRCKACKANEIHTDDCVNLMHGELKDRYCSCGVGTDWENWIIGDTFIYTGKKT